MKKRHGVLLVVFLTCCQVLGFLLFCKGFLLKRVVIPEYSNCSNPHTTHTLQSCYSQERRYKRVVWLLIDALRYDFVQWDEITSSPPIYRNKMPYVRKLLFEHPSNAKLFKFVADPPTSTMQRLKALTTGGLPTFIDISSNFNSYAILEDSIIRQVSKNDRNVTFMGDDTWLGLYPSMLTKVFPYPSLNVKDIHTVDEGVLSQLFSELKKGDADLVVGHFLGVDHIGHTYGPSHWTMGEKLPQMDQMIRDVVEAVDEETMVLVFGDHGMTSTGDHGGETELETHAALLVYSRQQLFHHQQPSGRSVYQIDLVPTVALLLGLPIPFSNLGMIIPELLNPTIDYSHTDGYSNGVTHSLLDSLRINANQIHTYLNTYAQYSGDFPQQVFDNLVEKLASVKSLHNASSPQATQTELTAIADGYVSYMREVKEMCHQVWAKFDDRLIFSGLFVVLLAVLSGFVLSNKVQWWNSVVLCAVVCAVVCIVCTGSLDDGLVILVYCIGALNFVIFSFCVFQFVFLRLASSLKKLPSLLDPLSVLSLLLAVLHAFSLLSNSFVLYEGDMVLFFLQTLIFCLALKRLCNESVGEKGGLVGTLLPYVALSVCLRLSKLFYSCRDLQYQDGCLDTTFTQPYVIALEDLGAFVNIRLLLSFIVVISIPILFFKVALRSVFSKFVPVLSVGRFSLPVAGLCVVLHWCVQLLPTNQLSYWHHVTLPWVVYIVCGVTLVMAVWRPTGVGVKGVKSEAITTLVTVVVVMCVWVPLTMLLNDGLALASGLIALQGALAVHLLSEAECPSVVVAVFWSLLSSHSFFSAGHTTTVTSLRVEAAFTGIHGDINKYNLPLAGLLVALNTLGPQLLFGLAMPLLWTARAGHTHQTHPLLKPALLLLGTHSLKLLVTMFAASLHRRHLMIWQVFTPRVLYEGAFTLTAHLGTILVLLIAGRVETYCTVAIMNE